MKANGVGAHIGGQSSWGIMLVVGLESAKAFGGTYRGSVRSATAAEQHAGVPAMRRRGVGADEAHHIYFIGTAVGLSADAGIAKLSIARQD